MHTVASDHIAGFQLGIGEICKARIIALSDNNRYIYPGEWGTTPQEEVWSPFSFDLTLMSLPQPIWLMKGLKTDVQIYLNLGLVETIQDAFFGTTLAFGYKFKGIYVSLHLSKAEPELTRAIVALRATAVSFTRAFNVPI